MSPTSREHTDTEAPLPSPFFQVSSALSSLFSPLLHSRASLVATLFILHTPALTASLCLIVAGAADTLLLVFFLFFLQKVTCLGVFLQTCITNLHRAELTLGFACTGLIIGQQVENEESHTSAWSKEGKPSLSLLLQCAAFLHLPQQPPAPEQGKRDEGWRDEERLGAVESKGN